jgi:hypothetical protein
MFVVDDGENEGESDGKNDRKTMEKLTGKLEVSEDTCMPRTSLALVNPLMMGRTYNATPYELSLLKIDRP